MEAVTTPAVVSFWLVQTMTLAQAFHKEKLCLWCDLASMCVSEQLNHLLAHQYVYPVATQCFPNYAAHLFRGLQLPYATQQFPIGYIDSELTSLL